MKVLIRKILNKLHLYNFSKNCLEKFRKKNNLSKKFKFEGEKQNKKKVCFVLAGYKDFLYDNLFGRIKKFLPEDIELCILSSGKYDEKLSKIASENGWSYLSTKRNNVALIQNIAINYFSKAKYIYKIDEDMFVTKHSFERLYDTYKLCEKNSNYEVGFVAPMIPINGFSHILILKRFNLLDYYTKKFEKPIYGSNPKRMIESNPDVAKFFWGEDKKLPSIDQMNDIVQSDEESYEICPVKFSIGMIFFPRETWVDMGMFHVDTGKGMGNDERQLCSYCMTKSKAIVVSKNTIVGHLSFGKQNEVMKQYFLDDLIENNY